MPAPTPMPTGHLEVGAGASAISAVFMVYSTQNEAQLALASRFVAIVRATEPGVPVHARRLSLRARSESSARETFGTDEWYDALVQKVTYWSRVARTHAGQTVLCADNDITLMPGWRQAMQAACMPPPPSTWRPSLCFQREGGDDPFFEPFPYNSGLFVMRASAEIAEFWGAVAVRTARERPHFGDQARNGIRSSSDMH